jgi:tetratricopeptide (TPR) repeat protein
VSIAEQAGEDAETTTGPLALHLLGILCAHEGRYYEAEDAFLRALEVGPEMVGSYMELGLVYAGRVEYGKMVEALRQAVEVCPGGVRAYLDERPLGDLTAARAPGEPEYASADARGGSESAHPPIASAMSLLAEGRDGEAAAVLEQALDAEPEAPPAVAALLALTYLLRGERVEADDIGVRRVPADAGGLARDG